MTSPTKIDRITEILAAHDVLDAEPSASLKAAILRFYAECIVALGRVPTLDEALRWLRYTQSVARDPISLSAYTHWLERLYGASYESQGYVYAEVHAHAIVTHLCLELLPTFLSASCDGRSLATRFGMHSDVFFAPTSEASDLPALVSVTGLDCQGIGACRPLTRGQALLRLLIDVLGVDVEADAAFVTLRAPLPGEGPPSRSLELFGQGLPFQKGQRRYFFYPHPSGTHVTVIGTQDTQIRATPLTELVIFRGDLEAAKASFASAFGPIFGEGEAFYRCLNPGPGHGHGSACRCALVGGTLHPGAGHAYYDAIRMYVRDTHAGRYPLRPVSDASRPRNPFKASSWLLKAYGLRQAVTDALASAAPSA